MERQKHGFAFEKFLNNMIDDFALDDVYTSEFDGFWEPYNVGVSVKIKNTKGELCLGSFHRIVQQNEPIVLLYGEYSKPYIPDFISALFLKNGFDPLFCGCQNQVQQLVTDFEEYMFSDDNFNSYSYDREWSANRRAFVNAYKNVFDENTIYVHPRPKRDHNSQRRLQCAIPKRYIKFILENYTVASLDNPLDAEQEDWDLFVEQVNQVLCNTL